MDDRDRKIERLELLVEELRNRVEELEGPRPRIFLAKRGATALQWQERTIVAGVAVDFTDGRRCTNDADPSKALAVGSDFFLYEFADPDGNCRYMPIGGGVSVRWGKATAAWGGSGNTITLTPCAGPTDGTASGEANVTCTIVSPSTGTPGVKIATNDILGYLPFGTNQGVLLPVGSMEQSDFVTDVSFDGTNITKTKISGYLVKVSGPTTTTVVGTSPCATP